MNLMRLPAGYCTAIESNGFAIVEDALTAEDAARLIAAVELAGDMAVAQGAHGLRNLLEKSSAVRELAVSGPARRLVEPILGPGAFAVRGLWFDKLPAANWKVAWHQDLSIAVRRRCETTGFSAWSVKQGVTHVQPPTDVLERMLAVRFHLDDSHLANGPLRVMPGSHRYGRLPAEEVARLVGERAAVACVAPRGAAVVMRPLVLHASSAAKNASHRRVIHLEFAAEDLPAGLDWHVRVGCETTIRT